MSILFDLQVTLEPLEIPVETGVFTGPAPEEYMVVVPLVDNFELFADNAPCTEVQEARISIFCKGNYLSAKNRVVRALLSAEFTITDRRYNGYETETGYHHYVVDVAKICGMEE